MGKNLLVDLPNDLYESIRSASYERKVSKKQIVVEALNLFFQKEPHVVITPPVQEEEKPKVKPLSRLKEFIFEKVDE